MTRTIQTLGLLVLCGSLLSAPAPLLAGASESPIPPSSLRSFQAPLSIEAARKIDPQILLALAIPDRSEESLRMLSRRIVIRGASADALSFPVLIRTTLSDADLATLGAHPDSRAGEIVSATVPAWALDALASSPGIEAIEASYWLHSNLDISIPETRANLINQGNPPSGYNGEGVLYGLMDDGIDVTHADFKNDQGTSRILYVWDHSREQNYTPPTGFTYGHEYTKAMIDAGQASQFVNTGGHGSHVAGISVGDGSSLGNLKYRGVAWKADIIAVRNGYCDLFCYGPNNPNPLFAADSKGSIDGMTYMIQKAAQLGKPLVVNQSQGVTLGPHDGTTLFEAAYNNFVQNDGLIVCIAAGNDEQRGWHGKKTVAQGGNVSFTINKDNSQGGDQWFQFEAWTRAGDRCRWELVTPGNQTLQVPAAVNPPNQYQGAQSNAGDNIYFWSTTSYSTNGQGNVSFYIQNNNAAVQGGNWTLRAIAENALPGGGQIDLYCERNQYTVEITNGLNTDNIVGMPGTCTNAITVASYNTKLSWSASDGNTYTVQGENPVGDISSFSSWGPRRDSAQKPDIAAPGSWIMSVLAAGHEIGAPQIDPGLKHMIISGTSMASPHVAGAIALMLQKNPSLTPAEVKSILTSTARTDGYTGSVPNKRFGHGKLDVKAAVDAVGGGGGVSCATRAGDPDGNNSVNILDVVVTVNHILLIQQLSQAAQACANVAEDQVINIQDVVGIVQIILGGGLHASRQAASHEPSAQPVAWTEEIDGATLRARFETSAAAGLEMKLIPAAGYSIAGDPRLEGSPSGASVAWSRRHGMITILAYNASGELLAGDGGLVIEVPMERLWDSGRELGRGTIVAATLTDRQGRLLPIAEPSAPEEEVPAPGPDRSIAAGRLRVAPNPMAGLTQIRYHLAASGPVDVSLYDAGGRKIRSLAGGWQLAGEHILHWDGREEEGHDLPGGIYFLHVESTHSTDSQKLVIVR